MVSLIAILSSLAAGALAAPVQPAETAPAPVSAVAADLPLAGLTDAAVFERAAEAIEGVDTLRGRFVQTAPDGTVTAGDLYLDRPGRLRFDYDAPEPLEIVATNGLIYVHDTDIETVDSYPVGQTPLRFLLAEEVDREGAVLREVTRGPGEIALRLASADEELRGEAVLVFAVGEGSEALSLARWAVIEPNGGVTVVALEDVERDVRLSRRLFRAPQPAGGLGLRDR